MVADVLVGLRAALLDPDHAPAHAPARRRPALTVAAERGPALFVAARWWPGVSVAVAI
ncbi:hypothetical protein [Paractinoplanes atraurantiacus]|uniref:hypothetical protein n=1 Tax=Paractinoplanes atraurantiacus TaxID=1036182 RepID=UPI0015CF4FBB|nr:hypothetical protein [Actinoplanes atraurantiacus]